MELARNILRNIFIGTEEQQAFMNMVDEVEDKLRTREVLEAAIAKSDIFTSSDRYFLERMGIKP